MQCRIFHSRYLPDLITWLMFLLGVENAALIWSGVFVAVPQAVLLLVGGLFGAAGIAFLGLLVWAAWGGLGLLLATVARRVVESRP